MFVLEQSPTFQAPVRLSIMPSAGGQRQVMEFTAVFARLSQDQLDSLGRRSVAEKWSDRRLAEELLRGWGTDVTANDQPLPYTPENREAVLNVAGCGAAVCSAFYAALPKAAEGN